MKEDGNVIKKLEWKMNLELNLTVGDMPYRKRDRDGTSRKL